jgi:hypothetical protein
MLPSLALKKGQYVSAKRFVSTYESIRRHNPKEQIVIFTTARTSDFSCVDQQEIV